MSSIKEKLSKLLTSRRAINKLVTSVMPFTSQIFPSGNTTLNQPSQLLIKKYRGWVYACANRNAHAVAQTPLRLFVTTKRSDKPPNVMTRTIDSDVSQRFNVERGPYIRNVTSKAISIEEVLEHPFLDLMNRANPIMDGFEVIELIELYQELIGDAYLYKIHDGLHTIREIWPLYAHLVKILPDPNTFIKGYMYGLGPSKVTFQPEDIVHFRFPNPQSYYYGMSPLSAAAAPVLKQENMDNYENSLFENRARPDQVLIPEMPIRRKDRERIEKDFNRVLRGVSSAGKTIVLPHGFRIEQLNFSPKELAFLESEKATQETIANIFDIPATLMTPKSGGRSKDEAAEYMHAKYGIWPRCKRMEQRLNQDLVSEYDPRLFCAFDNPVPKDKEFELKKRTADLRSGHTYINEVREREGKHPVVWGNEPLLPSNMIPLSEAIANQRAARVKKESINVGKGDAPISPTDDVKPGRIKSPDGADKKD